MESSHSLISFGQIDGSLVDLAPSAYDMIVATLPSSPAASHPPDPHSAESPSKITRQLSATSNAPSKGKSPLSPRAQGKQAQRNAPLPNESFVLLQDSVVRTIPSPTPPPTRARKGTLRSHVGPTKDNPADSPPSRTVEQDHANPSPLSHHLRSTARLFNLLSTRTDIDHPLCAECTQILLTNLQRQLDETKKERDGYIAFEKEVRKERERESQGPSSKEEAERKIEKLKQEEALAVEQLKAAEREREQLDFELHQLEINEKALEGEEAECVFPFPDHY